MLAECLVKTLQTGGGCECGDAECESARYWEEFTVQTGYIARAWRIEYWDLMSSVWVYFVEHAEYMARGWTESSSGFGGVPRKKRQANCISKHVRRATVRGHFEGKVPETISLDGLMEGYDSREI